MIYKSANKAENMREANIWVLIADGETARICSTREGRTTPIAAFVPCGTYGGRE